MANGFVGGWACPQCGYMPTAMGTMGMAWGHGFAPGTMPGMVPGFGMPSGGFPMGFMPPMAAYGPGFFGPGFFGPRWMAGMRPGMPGMMPGYTYPTFATTGVPSDEQIREMIYDAIDADPVVPYDADINVEVTGGVVTLTGTVPNKRVKHAVGDDAWWVPGVWDVNNNLQITGRRPAREGSETSTGQGEQ